MMVSSAVSRALAFFVVIFAHSNRSSAYLMPGSVEWMDLESDGGPFQELMDSLSGILQKATPTLWRDECSGPFQEEGFPLLDVAPYGLVNSSNYELFEQPSGLCTDHLSCAYVGCFWPFGSTNSTETTTTAEEAFATANFPNKDQLNLPKYVLHPKAIGDIIAVVTFAAEHDIAISVKTSGHSYLGGSTSKGSILVHMSSYVKYTDDWDTALIECQPFPDEGNTTSGVEYDPLCALAWDRGAMAALRVGGGQVWDEVYRAVHTHNAQTVSQEYHIVGAAAGTVSVAGGWMSGGGLSGTAGMRMFGFGVDQILSLEMVLANGKHVRFGPSKWDVTNDASGSSSSSSSSSSFPKTTDVRGECNMGSTTTDDESQWDWQPCPEDDSIDFAGLWYAVRGGGAGYGVVTSAVYQLHKKPGKLQILANVGIPEEVKLSLQADAIKAIRELWISFAIDFFFNPTSLNITEEHSNACGSPAVAFTMDPFVDGTVYCHNGSGTYMVDAWQKLVSEANNSLTESGVHPEGISAMVAVFSIIREVEDVVESSYFLPAIRPALSAGVPPGRMFDFPKPNTVPTYYDSHWNAILPRSWILNKERSIPFLLDYASTNRLFAKFFYVLGGRTMVDHDWMNAITPSQRDASFVIPTLGSVEFTEKLLTEIYGEIDGSGDFPPGAEYNHVGVNEYGPLKEDWTKACPMSLSRKEKDEQCVSLQESVWGTSILTKLIGIKNSVDPDNRFNCFGCAGYVDIHTSASVTDETAPTAVPTTISPDASAAASSITTLHGFVFFCWATYSAAVLRVAAF